MKWIRFGHPLGTAEILESEVSAFEGPGPRFLATAAWGELGDLGEEGDFGGLRKILGVVDGVGGALVVWARAGFATWLLRCLFRRLVGTQREEVVLPNQPSPEPEAG